MDNYSLAPHTLKTTAESGDIMEIDVEDDSHNDQNSVAASSAFEDDDDEEEEADGGELQLKRAAEANGDGDGREKDNWWCTYRVQINTWNSAAGQRAAERRGRRRRGSPPSKSLWSRRPREHATGKSPPPYS